MAKKKSTPKTNTTIPESLEKHIHEQQDALRMVTSVLVCAGDALNEYLEEPASSVR